MSERTTIDVIIVEPMKPPRMVTLNDNLESIRRYFSSCFMWQIMCIEIYRYERV